MKNNIKNTVLFQKVKELGLPIGKYALFGSAPMGIRGLKECKDIDIIVTEDLWNEYKNKGWKMTTMQNGKQKLSNNCIELWNSWKPFEMKEWNVLELIKDSEIIDGLSFVKIKYVLEWKKLSTREKDIKDVKIIEKFLKN